MIINNHEYFEEIEIEHDFHTYYANGYVAYRTTACVGTNYEWYDYETVYESEISDITISQLWYYDEERDDYVHILGQHKYQEVEEIALEEIRYRFE